MAKYGIFRWFSKGFVLNRRDGFPKPAGDFPLAVPRQNIVKTKKIAISFGFFPANSYLCSMKRLLTFSICCIWLCLSAVAQHTIIVKAGDVNSLLQAIEEVNKANAAKDAKRSFVIIPDGIYDLGDRVKTPITGNNIAFIGQSMRGTVICNKPDYHNEGISKTAVLLNRGEGNYFQDLTLRNNMEYYTTMRDGRAVALHDKGTQTICHRVCLDSHQDTYYADNEACQHYFQESEIHGTVDFICGSGDVWFEQCRIVTEPRHMDTSGRNVIAAPRTAQTTWGFIFNHCTIENKVSKFQYARGWHTRPRCTWLYTKLLTPERLLPTRFDAYGIKVVENNFKEYGTTDAEGHDITPKSNVVTFICKGDSLDVETILQPDDAKRFCRKRVYTTWNPMKTLSKTQRQAAKLTKRL